MLLSQLARTFHTMLRRICRLRIYHVRRVVDAGYEISPDWANGALLFVPMKRKVYRPTASPTVIVWSLRLRSPREGVKVGRP